MLVNYYCVYDCIADEYGPMFPHRNDSTAFRAYELGFKSSPDGQERNPDEYQLWFVGSFDDSQQNANKCIFDNSNPHRVYVDREE